MEGLRMGTVTGDRVCQIFPFQVLACTPQNTAVQHTIYAFTHNIIWITVY